MTVTQAQLIIDSVNQLRKTVIDGFNNAKQEREVIAEEVKLISEWKNQQQGKQQAVKESEKNTDNYRVAFIATLSILVVALLTVAGMYIKQ